jgi:CheY-like chemotaxis protein
MPWLKRILAIGAVRPVIQQGNSELERHGYSLVFTQNAADAHALIDSFDFDLIVLPHQGKRTLEAIREIRARHPKARFAVIHRFPSESTPLAEIPRHMPHDDGVLSDIRFIFDRREGPRRTIEFRGAIAS